MDYQRILILLGLAVTSYLLILAWNEDYGQGRSPDIPAVASEGVSNIPSAPTQNTDTLPPGLTPQATDHKDFIPTIGSPEGLQPTKIFAVETDRFIRVTTDVLALTIDKHGGDITSVSLREYPTKIETPDEPLVLVDPRNAYSAQSGLIGPNATDTAAGRPMFSSYSNEYELGEDEELTVELSFEQEDGVWIIKEYKDAIYAPDSSAVMRVLSIAFSAKNTPLSIIDCFHSGVRI